MSGKQKKQATRGSKQIVEENEATIKFYRNMSAGAFLIYIVASFILGVEYTTTNIILLILLLIIYVGCVNLLSYAAKATYSEDGKAIIDSGTDLNMEGGIAEHVKDAIILSTVTQILSLGSSYFWLLLLLAPIRAFFMLWKSVLAPWFFQQSVKPEVDEKKQRKMDRRMNAAHNN